MLSSYNSLCDSKWCYLSGCFAPFQQWSASQWAILCIRLLCSLPTLVICTVVCQVALLPSYNSKATASLLCSLPVPILFSFVLIYLNLFEFCRVFEWKERECWPMLEHSDIILGGEQLRCLHDISTCYNTQHHRMAMEEKIIQNKIINLMLM